MSRPVPSHSLITIPIFLIASLWSSEAGGTLGHAARTSPPATHAASAPGAEAQADALTRGDIGFDISWPQCGGHFPKSGDFRIVGVNRGRVYTENPCLGAGHGHSELRWAGRDAQLYINTGNPRPRQTDRWPIGQVSPRHCSGREPNSRSCSFDYGWNAARNSYQTAVRAYVSLGWAEPGSRRTPRPVQWWLDVETANSWRTHDGLNVAALRGAVTYLEHVEAQSIGFYSAPSMWADITGRTTAFDDYPSWVAGASTLAGARARCDGPGFTGGGVSMAQFFKNGFDADLLC